MGYAQSKEETGEVNAFVEAAKEGDLDTIRLLKHHLNGRDERHETALLLASVCGRTEIVRELCSDPSALEVDAKDQDEATALMHAAAGGYFEIVRLLVRTAKADVALKDRLGWTAVHHAAADGHSFVVQYLVDHGGDPFAKDSSGSSPLWLACHSGDAETVRILLLMGADPGEVNLEDVSVREVAAENEGKDEDEESQGEEEEDAEKKNLILEMVDVALFAWDEARTEFGRAETYASAPAPSVLGPNSEDKPGSILPLYGNEREGPQIPALDDIDDDGEYKALVDDEAGGEDVTSVTRRMREYVVRRLKLEDAFVETYASTMPSDNVLEE